MSEDDIRIDIEKRLAAGLKTEIFPRADTQEETAEIIRRLQISDGSLEAKLVIGGFAFETIEHGDIEQHCETCMYYLVKRKYCDLPELAVPVEPRWSCRLWRI